MLAVAQFNVGRRAPAGKPVGQSTGSTGGEEFLGLHLVGLYMNMNSCSC